MIRGDEKPFRLNEQRLTISNDVKDLGITVSKKLTWTAHVNLRMKKANGVLYSIRRNVAFKVDIFVKLGLYKSLVLPVLLYELSVLRYPI